MRKDFYYAAAVVAAAHSGLIWLSSLSRHVAAPAHSDTVTRMVQIVMPPIEPDPEPVALDAEPPKTQVDAPPTLADIPVLNPTSPFTIAVEPSPPHISDKQMIKLPDTGGHYGSAEGIPVYNPGDLAHLPEAIARPAPNYPFEQKRTGVEGTVTVEFVITKTGKVTSARAVSPEGSPFAQAAVQGVYRWRFHPGIRGGIPVATRMQVPIVFSLNQD
jgi:protein TonB